MFVESQVIWNAFGRVIDPPIVHTPVADSIRFGLGVGAAKGVGRVVNWLDRIGNSGRASEQIRVARQTSNQPGDTANLGNSAQSARTPWGTNDDLINSATTPGKGGVTPVGRAFQKHAGNPSRAGTFTGDVSGNASQNTQSGVRYLNSILNNPNSKFTVRDTTAHGKVLDVRMPDGTGARWSADGSRFITFLERYTLR